MSDEKMGGGYEEKHFQRNLVSTCTVSSRGTVGVCGVGSACVHTTVQHVFPNFVSNCVLVLTAFFPAFCDGPLAHPKKSEVDP